MHSKQLSVFVLSFLLLFAPVAPVAASAPSGQMFTKGTAKINGVVAPGSTSIFAGDRIATEKETTTSLSFSGGDAVVITELSKAALGDANGRAVLNLEDGAVSALNKSMSPVAIEAGGARIQAAPNQTAAFDVILHGNTLRVIARVGTARVETANKSADLTAGHELDATLAPPDPSPKPAQPAAAPSPLPSGLSHATTWIIIGSVAGATTGVVLGAIALDRTNNCRLSPSNNAIIC